MTHAKIGPNSIIQTVQALKNIYGPPKALEILHQVGRADLPDNLPTAMVAEQDFFSLVHALTTPLNPDELVQVLTLAGQLTAAYLLKHRIPQPFQQLLKLLPRQVGLPLFMFVIGKNAWTFVGSGQFRFVNGPEPMIILANQAPETEDQTQKIACSFYRGTFEKLLQTLIEPKTLVRKAEHLTMNDVRCAYTITFSG